MHGPRRTPFLGLLRRKISSQRHILEFGPKLRPDPAAAAHLPERRIHGDERPMHQIWNEKRVLRSEEAITTFLGVPHSDLRNIRPVVRLQKVEAKAFLNGILASSSLTGNSTVASRPAPRTGWGALLHSLVSAAAAPNGVARLTPAGSLVPKHISLLPMVSAIPANSGDPSHRLGSIPAGTYASFATSRISSRRSGASSKMRLTSGRPSSMRAASSACSSASMGCRTANPPNMWPKKICRLVAQVHRGLEIDGLAKQLFPRSQMRSGRLPPIQVDCRSPEAPRAGRSKHRSGERSGSAKIALPTHSSPPSISLRNAVRALSRHALPSLSSGCFSTRTET